MSKPVKLSASQIKLFKRCQRKWGFRYVDGIVGPSTPAQQFGTDTHTVLENYLKHGVWKGDADHVAVAKQGLEALPKPGVALVEHPFALPILGGDALLRGVIDAVVSKPPTRVIDHKITSDLKYRMSEKKLQLDEQQIIYTYVAFNMLGAEQVQTSWLYYGAKKAKTPTTRPRKPSGFKITSGSFDRDDNQRLFDARVLPTAALMTEKKHFVVSANELEPNQDACMDFNGCEYLNRCTARASMFAKIETGEKTKMGKLTIKEILAQKKAKQAPVSESEAVAASEPTPVEAKKEEQPKAEVKAPATKKTRATKKRKPTGYTLLVNASFYKNAQDCTHASEYVAPVKREIESEKKVEYWNSLQYREGEILLAQKLADKLAASPPDEYLYIDRDSIEWKACGEVLVEHAARVIGAR